ncbi:hypothetical protein CYMTET_33514, partial [Cymbomonas tetramitiformis]
SVIFRVLPFALDGVVHRVDACHLSSAKWSNLWAPVTSQALNGPTWIYRAGQECVDSCVAQLESGNWPGEHWSHAFLLGHSFVALAQLDMLEGALAEDVHDTLIQTGLTWKAIFRHSVILERPPEWLGRLLRLLERTLHYHLPYPDVDLGGQDDEVAYTIPSQMPTTGVPVIAPASQ